VALRRTGLLIRAANAALWDAPEGD